VDEQTLLARVRERLDVFDHLPVLGLGDDHWHLVPAIDAIEQVERGLAELGDTAATDARGRVVVYEVAINKWRLTSPESGVKGVVEGCCAWGTPETVHEERKEHDRIAAARMKETIG